MYHFQVSSFPVDRLSSLFFGYAFLRLRRKWLSKPWFLLGAMCSVIGGLHILYPLRPNLAPIIIAIAGFMVCVIAWIILTYRAREVILEWRKYEEEKGGRFSSLMIAFFGAIICVPVSTP